MNIPAESPLAIAVTSAIREGNQEALEGLLKDNAGLFNARILDRRGGGRTLLHITADWPGHFPNGARTVKTLLKAGADVNGLVEPPLAGKPDETPLHWAASSNDVEVLDALIDGGADLEAPGACIAGGTPLDDAVAFGQWNAARRLVERGAKTALWHAAALGLMDRVEAHFSGNPMAAPYPWGKSAGLPVDEVTIAFWCACHGGQKGAAEFLLGRGAKLNWVSPWDQLTPLDAAERSGAKAVVEWLRNRGGKSAKEIHA